MASLLIKSERTARGNYSATARRRWHPLDIEGWAVADTREEAERQAIARYLRHGPSTDKRTWVYEDAD